MAAISGEWRGGRMVRPDGYRVADIRPRVRLNVAIVVGEGDRMETGGHGAGGRTGYAAYFAPEAWRACVDEALRQATVNLEAVPTPAGEMQVVLGSGRSEEHTSELQSLMRISYAVFCLKKKKTHKLEHSTETP